MRFTELISSLALPSVMGILAFAFLFVKRVSFDTFAEGAREGLRGAVGLLPSLCAIVVGVKMLSASGAIDFIGNLLSPAASFLGVPSELITLLLTRPFSGSASVAAYSELMAEQGADSFPSFCASVIMGSSDTIVYIIGIYFSSVEIKHSRYAFTAAFAVMLFCIFFSCLVSRFFFA